MKQRRVERSSDFASLHFNLVVTFPRNGLVFFFPLHRAFLLNHWEGDLISKRRLGALTFKCHRLFGDNLAPVMKDI